MPRKLALLAGIENYPTAPIPGPLDDVIDMANFLFDYRGFGKTEVIPVTNQRATASNLKTYIEQVVDILQPGDDGMFFFTGHGAQVPTLTPTLEPDGMDEVLCTADFDWTPERMITDKWLHGTLRRLRPGVNFMLVCDCCHSGDLTREMPFGVAAQIIRAMPVPHDIQWMQQAASEEGFVAKKDLSDNPLSLAFISGCRAEQTSASFLFNQRYNGALTYFLLKVLKELPPFTPVVQIVAKVTEYLIANGFAQRPQVEGMQINNPFLFHPLDIPAGVTPIILNAGAPDAVVTSTHNT